MWALRETNRGGGDREADNIGTGSLYKLKSEWEGGIHKNSHIYGWDERPSFTDIKSVRERMDLKGKLQFRTLKLTQLCVIQVDMAIAQFNMWAQSTGGTS